MTNPRTRTRTQKYPLPRKRLGPLALCAALALPALAGGLFAAPASAADAEATEGSKVVFTVQKPNFSGYNSTFRGSVRYSYKTVDDTAKAGDDYKAVSGKVTFGVSTTSRKIEVKTYEDNVDEGDGETFELKLTDPRIAHRCITNKPPYYGICWRAAEGVVADQIVQTGEILEP